MTSPGSRDPLVARVVESLGEHQVAQFDAAVGLADEDVAGADVAMQDVEFVRDFERFGHPFGDVDRVPPVEHAGHADAANHLARRFRPRQIRWR